VELDSYFRGLLASIEPDPSAVAIAKKCHEELRSTLQSDEEVSKADPDSFLAGSYARHTAIRDIKDVDIILLLDLDQNGTAPEVVVAWVQAALQRYYSKVRPQGRSVRVTTDGDFELDVVPAVPMSRRDGPVWIPDRDAAQWVPTHPKGQIAFSVQRNADTEQYYKHLVKMMKYWRDRLPSALARPNSYIIESLVASQISVKPAYYAHAVVRMLSGVDSAYSVHVAAKIVPNIPDPGYSTVNVAKRWKLGEFQAFMEAVKKARGIAEAALKSEDEDKSVALWRELFGNRFQPRS